LIIMKTKLRERLTMYRCFIRPKVHCSPEFSFKTRIKALRFLRCSGFILTLVNPRCFVLNLIFEIFNIHFFFLHIAFLKFLMT